MGAAILLYGLWDNDPSLVPALMALPFLVAITVINVQKNAVPVSLSLPIAMAGATYAFLQNDFLSSIAAGLVVVAVMGGAGWLVFGRKNGQGGPGPGDLTLLAGAGFFTGITGLPLFFALNSTIIFAAAILCAISGRKNLFFLSAIFAGSLLFHLFLTGMGFDGKGIY